MGEQTWEAVSGRLSLTGGGYKEVDFDSAERQTISTKLFISVTGCLGGSESLLLKVIKQAAGTLVSSERGVPHPGWDVELGGFLGTSSL